MAGFVPSAVVVRADPGRIAAGAITGMGFIGAGVVLKLGANVQGLTTAASLWMVSALGLALGTGLYVESTVAFLITIFALLVLGTVERIIPANSFKTVRLKAHKDFDESMALEVFSKYGAKVISSDYVHEVSEGECSFRYTIALRGIKTKMPFHEIARELSALQGVKRVAIES